MTDNIYETEKLVNEYLLFHYGTDEVLMPWSFGPREALGFPVRTVHELIALPAQGRALDLGCAVGRSSFELAMLGFEVTGVDYSQAFINNAKILQRQPSMPCIYHEEGFAKEHLEIIPPGTAEQRAAVNFQQGDAVKLDPQLGQFDVVHAANLLCRVRCPSTLLGNFGSLVKPGGQLLLTTPCTWLEEFTDRNRWPFGSTQEWLKEQMDRNFILEHERDMPFIIREHARKYQWSVAWGTRWRRRS